MNKTKIIIKREYLSRVRKKSFVVMTILGPLMICALLVIPVLLQQTGESRSEIIVVDATAERLDDKSVAIFKNKFKSDDAVHYTYSDDIEAAQKILKDNSCDAVLEIVSTSDNPPIKSFLYYGENEPGLKVQEQTKNQILNILRNSILQYDYGMNEKQIEWINNPTIDFYTKNILTGESSFNEIKTILGAVGGFLIYMFIFIFGSMVMKGVSEEKTNRIVEVLVSSVKPVQLLMGKLIAIALVGLTQFAMWVVLTVGIISFVQAASPELFAPTEQEQITVNERVITVDKLNSVESSEANELVQGLMAINYPLVIGMFLFFFIAGYFLYASLFGAIGSLIDIDTDGQQFTLPVTIPMIIAIVSLPMVMENPSGSAAFWLSVIPFTSPVAMMVRIPFGVPVWQLAVSVGLMIVTIVLCVAIAAKIYKTAILMYGKKITYKEIWKWLRYKNA